MARKTKAQILNEVLAQVDQALNPIKKISKYVDSDETLPPEQTAESKARIHNLVRGLVSWTMDYAAANPRPNQTGSTDYGVTSRPFTSGEVNDLERAMDVGDSAIGVANALLRLLNAGMSPSDAVAAVMASSDYAGEWLEYSPERNVIFVPTGYLAPEGGWHYVQTGR